ncbi:hypothetical protein [Aeromonas veronii]|uniref:Lipoprotein n=1 Tax=Aeromonas veronii TaxID=654 RepID=A0A4S5CGY1_AERVE|nr:hypothetical protein [Aeromonas veronii]THJ45097.1 hypothetical protein E8Q35_13020 [Aeromonas veronii]
MTNKMILVFASACLLSACDSVTELKNTVVRELVNATPPVTLVFPSGSKLLVGGKPSFISGSDACSDGQKNCVVITPDTELVEVFVASSSADAPRQEIWTVKRDGDKTMLLGTDGSQIGYVD